MTITFDGHALRRMRQRHLPLHIVRQIANVGVPVHEDHKTILVRGMWDGQPVHVLKMKATNSVWTAYIANEWDCHIQVRHVRKRHDVIVKDSNIIVNAFADGVHTTKP